HDGPEALYDGPIGRAYVAGLNAAGSSIAIEDLAAHRALVLPPFRAAFRDLHISVVPPNSQGFVLLEILALLERLGVDADPEHMTAHASTLLDDGHLASHADEIRLERPAPLGSRSSGDTIALAAADS